MSKERPILFNREMVRAILQGRKTQTRRVVKPIPPDCINELHGGFLSRRAPYKCFNEESQYVGFGFSDDNGNVWKCPYGKPGASGAENYMPEGQTYCGECAAEYWIDEEMNWEEEE